jgi:integrase
LKKSRVGAVRTKQKCPRCGGRFEGEPLRCPSCLTTPSRYFVDFSWPGQGRKKLYSDQQGYALTSWEQSKRLLNDIDYEIDKGTFDPKKYCIKEPDSLRVDKCAMAWLEQRENERKHGYISRSYLIENRDYVRRYFIPFWGSMSIRDIREGHLEDFKNWLPRHLSPKTVANVLGILHKLFKYAFRRGYILLIPEFPKVEQREPLTRWISEEDQRKVLAQMDCPVRWAFYLFLMKQGCRPGEARALRWENVDLKNDIVTIAAGFNRNEFKPYTKERDIRYLPLHPEVKKALLALPRQLSGWVFTYQDKPLSQWLVSNYWRLTAQKAGIKVTCYEGTRHSLASQAVQRGVSERKIGDMLGHKCLTSTRRYAKLHPQDLRQIWGEEFVVPHLSPSKKGS